MLPLAEGPRLPYKMAARTRRPVIDSRTPLAYKRESGGRESSSRRRAFSLFHCEREREREKKYLGERSFLERERGRERYFLAAEAEIVLFSGGTKRFYTRVDNVYVLGLVS